MKAVAGGTTGTLSQFPAMYKGKLTRQPEAGGMSTTTTLSIEPAKRPVVADVEIVVPVYNEQQDLAVSIGRLHSYLSRNFPLSWLITVADNASTDSTWAIACRWPGSSTGSAPCIWPRRAGAVPCGRHGCKATLQSSPTWMSTCRPTSTPVASRGPAAAGHSDVAIGSRLARGPGWCGAPSGSLFLAATTSYCGPRCITRFLTRSAVSKLCERRRPAQLLPLVEDNAWFFDTELLVLAERNGLRVHEVAVDWVDDPGSTVDLVRTARDDLKGIARMMRHGASCREQYVAEPKGRCKT